MAKYITRLRRGWKDSDRNDWAEYETRENHLKPYEGEVVLEYVNGMPKFKVGDGVSEFSQLPYVNDELAQNINQLEIDIENLTSNGRTLIINTQEEWERYCSNGFFEGGEQAMYIIVNCAIRLNGNFSMPEYCTHLILDFRNNVIYSETQTMFDAVWDHAIAGCGNTIKNARFSNVFPQYFKRMECCIIEGDVFSSDNLLNCEIGGTAYGCTGIIGGTAKGLESCNTVLLNSYEGVTISNCTNVFKQLFVNGTGKNSIAGPTMNPARVLGEGNIAFGVNNGWDLKLSGTHNLISGTNHNIYGNRNIIGGSNHMVSQYGDDGIIGGRMCYLGAMGTLAIGNSCGAHQSCSSALGEETDALRAGQTVVGRYSYPDGDNPPDNPPEGLFIVGGGTSDTNRANIFRVTPNAVYGGQYNTNSADYAEYFEWLDGNPESEDRVGYFVTLDGDKIRKCTSKDDYILGIVSGNPAVVGDTQSDWWVGRYLKDEFGRYIKEEKTFEIKDEEGTVISTYTEKVNVLNPEFDATKEYIPRSERKEWSAVGTMGKLVVRDDGTCIVNGYCKPNDEGVATNSESGYRVIQRISDTLIKVWIS